MPVVITSVAAGSKAAKSNIKPGEKLVFINGRPINDLLDYRFYLTDKSLELLLEAESGEQRTVSIKKGEYDDIGLEFESYLMDKENSCRNSCVFCFIDQLPKGMRETLYFKDDDERLSFLTGNYITLTNLAQEQVDRIIKMRLSPVNLSVHTANPKLRCEMMGNRFAGEVLKYIPQMHEAGIKMNAQLVLCPGINDGDELRFSLEWLGQFYPSVQSVACVPVGLTAHREGLRPLRLFTQEEAAQVIGIIDSASAPLQKKFGERVFFASDEFYLRAKLPFPPYESYGEFAQLENGVGLMPLLGREFDDALEATAPFELNRRVTIATGAAAFDFICGLATKAQERYRGLKCGVKLIKNSFFGETITVAGLVTGRDIISVLEGGDLGEELLFPSVMLRADGEVFLDDITPEELSERLGVRVQAVENDGFALLDAMLGA